ncbi:MAG: efflux RND transporter periplasmic adaptor subunit [Pirellula sp.]
MKLNRNKLVVVVASLLVPTLGGAIAFHNMHSEEIHHKLPNVLKLQTEPLNPNGTELLVRAYQVSTSTHANCVTQTFTGTLQPRFLASVGFRVAGKISERKVEVGQSVKKGQLLFRLDPADLDLQLRVAEADQISAKSLLRQAKAEESRSARLVPSGTVSQSDYDLTLAARDVALSRVDAAERRLLMAMNQREYCDLVADENGMVTAIHAEVGQVVNIGQPVLQLMHGEELEAVVNLPENLVEEAKRLEADASFWSRPGLQVRAELREVASMADPISRTYDAKFKLAERVRDLAIGMTVSIRLSDHRDEGLAVPLTSISSNNGQPIVWRLVSQGKSHRVEAVPVEVLRYRTDTANIKGALRDGDRIASAGVQRIDENTRVRIWEAR